MKTTRLSTIFLLAGILLIVLGGISTFIFVSSDQTEADSAAELLASASVTASEEAWPAGTEATETAAAETAAPETVTTAPEVSEAPEAEEMISPDTEASYEEFPDQAEDLSEAILFPDVAEDSYCYDAVCWTTANGIAYGTSETTFSPDDSCSRAQVVTFLWRLAGEPEPQESENPFEDVVTDPSSDLYNAIMWAVESGITSGTSETTFSPDDPCTRGQVVTFLWRYAGEPDADSAKSFDDVTSDNPFYTPIMWTVEAGITSGTSDTTFSPDDPCTRGQVVTFLYRYAG